MLISRNDFDSAAIDSIRHNHLPCGFPIVDYCNGIDIIIRIKGDRAEWLSENHPELVLYDTNDVYIEFDDYYELAAKDTCNHEFDEQRVEEDSYCVVDYIYWQWFVFINAVDFAVLCNDAWTVFGLSSYQRQILSSLEGTDVAARREIGFLELDRIVKTIDKVLSHDTLYIAHIPFDRLCELAAMVSCYDHGVTFRDSLVEKIERALHAYNGDLDDDEIEDAADLEAMILCDYNESIDE